MNIQIQNNTSALHNPLQKQIHHMDAHNRQDPLYKVFTHFSA